MEKPHCGSLERFPEQVFERRRRAEPDSPARPAHDVRCLAHRLGAAGQHDVRLAQQNLLRALDDGFETGTAEPVHGDRGSLDGEARLESDVPRHVDGVGTGLQRVAEDDMIDLAWFHLGPLECRLRGDDAEVDCG